MSMTKPISRLDVLEAESIHIFREAAAQFRKPVLLYSIGKDSSVLLHLAPKAFFPQRIPFPLLHIDTTWKFRDMIAFRDRTARDLGLDLIVHVNEAGRAQGINPIDYAPSLYTDVMKTEALRQALDRHGFDAAFGRASLGSAPPAPGDVEPAQWPSRYGRERARLSPFELD